MYTIHYDQLNRQYTKAAYLMWDTCLEGVSPDDFYNMYDGCFFE